MIIIVNSPDRKDDDTTYVDEIMYGISEKTFFIYSLCGYDDVATIMGSKYKCNIIIKNHTFEYITMLMKSVFKNDYCIVMPSKGRDDGVTEDVIRRFPNKENLFVR